MSAKERKEQALALSQIAANAGAGWGSGGPMGDWNERIGATNSSLAQAAADKEAQEEAEKAKKGSTWGKIGSMLGSIVLPVVAPGLGTVAGAALGAAGGNAIGQLAGSGRVDAGGVVGSGLTGAAGGMMGNMLGTESTATQAAGEAASAATKLDPMAYDSSVSEMLKYGGPQIQSANPSFLSKLSSPEVFQNMQGQMMAGGLLGSALNTGQTSNYIDYTRNNDGVLTSAPAITARQKNPFLYWGGLYGG